jgi:Flp pilus assembly protein TadG
MTNRHRRRPDPRPRLHGDDGAVVLELAFVAPVLIVFLLGIFEFGTVFHNETILASALRGAARLESQIPNQAQSGTVNSVDIQAIGTFMAGLSGLTNMTLQRVIIYDAPTGGAAPAACRTLDVTTAPLGPHGRPSGLTAATQATPVAGTSCNVYSPQQVQAIQDYLTKGTALPAGAFNSSCTIGSTWDEFYCPTYRVTTFGGTLDQIGVYAVFTYTDVTSLIGKTMTVSDTAVYTAQPNV